MNTRFDNEVEASWGRFEVRLVETLAALGEDSLVLEAPGELDADEVCPYVQFAGNDGWIRAEVSGNVFLGDRFSLDIHQEEALEALGWQQPSDDDSPNFWFDLSLDELHVLPSMVTGALRRVFGVVHPDFLVGGSGWPVSGVAPADLVAAPDPQDEADLDEPLDLEAALAFPDDHEHLVRLVAGALARVHGSKPPRDDDGDFPISTGTVPLWVRVERDRPVVRIFSYVVRSVRDVRQARTELGILNERQDLLKFTIDSSVIVATYDLPAVPFVEPQLTWTIRQIGEQLDDLAADTARRVNGKLWLEPATRAEPGRGSHE